MGVKYQITYLHAFLLLDDVVSLALCPQVVSQAPQHFRSSEKQDTWEGCFASLFDRSFPFTPACLGGTGTPTGVFEGVCQPLTHSSLGFKIKKKWRANGPDSPCPPEPQRPPAIPRLVISVVTADCSLVAFSRFELSVTNSTEHLYSSKTVWTFPVVQVINVINRSSIQPDVASYLMWTDLASNTVWTDLASYLMWTDLGYNTVWTYLASYLMWTDLASNLMCTDLASNPVWTNLAPYLMWTDLASSTVWTDLESCLMWTDLASNTMWTDLASNQVWTDLASNTVWIDLASIQMWTDLHPTQCERF